MGKEWEHKPQHRLTRNIVIEHRRQVHWAYANHQTPTFPDPTSYSVQLTCQHIFVMWEGNQCTWRKPKGGLWWTCKLHTNTTGSQNWTWATKCVRQHSSISPPPCHPEWRCRSIEARTVLLNVVTSMRHILLWEGLVELMLWSYFHRISRTFGLDVRIKE